MFYVVHQACAYRSSRFKWTTCPDESSTHKHLPWGVVRDERGTCFAASEETAYPHPLAAEIALCFAEALKAKVGIRL